MKLCNFLRFDPDYKGKGLTAGGKLEEVIWNEFAGNRPLLRETAASILSGAAIVSDQKPEGTRTEDPDDEFPEGRILTRLHKMRERNRALVNTKKRRVLAETGRLECEACGFDFHKFYGEAGKGFIECHHNKPLSEAASNHRTSINELSLLCANCHRIIHRSRPWLSAQDLGIILRERSLEDSAANILYKTL